MLLQVALTFAPYQFRDTGILVIMDSNEFFVNWIIKNLNTMKKLFCVLALCFCGPLCFGQTTAYEAGIKQTVNAFFDGMRKADTAMIRSTIAKDVVLQSVANKKDGTTALVTENIADFIGSIAKPHKELYDERITFNDIKIDGDLAMVWAPYKFYIGQTFSHCGVDVFQLMKTTQGWKIIYIVDTRRKEKCVE
jgi:ketosteroid isomerase-like protein